MGMTIGLLAMSGVRVCDPELLRVGLTLPGFVERSKVIASLPSLGLLTLAALTPPAHRVRYFEAKDVAEAEEHFASLCECDLVAISSLSAQINEAYAIADRLREKGVRVVIGGLHATVLPDEAGQHADAVVSGEGEPLWQTIIADAERGSLNPRYHTDGDYDLARAPIPRYELITISKYNRLTVQTSRGCPHHCTFCASSILLSPRYKQKPAENVLREIDAIREIWNQPFIEFADDNSFVDRTYWRSLLPKLARRRIRWFAETDVSIARDADLLDMMHDAGCAQLLMGFESPNHEGLQGIELRADWKTRQWPRYHDIVRSVQERGISVNGCFVVGLDVHGPEIFDDIFNFVRDLGVHQVQVTIQTPFPGTPLYDRLKNSRRLLEPDNWRLCTLFDLNYQPTLISPNELRTGFRDLVARIYADDAIEERRGKFRRMMRAGLASRNA